MALLYFGPELAMPLVSALAALAGSLLMFGRRMLAGVRSVLRRVRAVFRRGRRPESPPDRDADGSRSTSASEGPSPSVR